MPVMVSIMHCFAVTNPPSACMCAQNNIITVLVWHFNFGFEEEGCGVGNIFISVETFWPTSCQIK